MEYFTLLTLATVAIAILAWVLYRRSGDLGVLLGTAALYYWSLYGAWYVVVDKSGGFSGKFYHYLEYKMFPVNLDSNYLATLASYAAFILFAQISLLLALPDRRAAQRNLPRILLRHEPILAIAAAAAAGSIFLIAGKISTAWSLNASAYYYTRTQTDEWFTLHQVLNRVAMIPPAIGFATYLAGNRSRYFVSLPRRATLLGYLAVFTVMAAFTFVLGNKNEVLVSLITGFLCYFASVRRPRLLRVAATLIVGLWFLYAIDFFRSVPISSMEAALSGRIQEATEVGRFVTSSNEAYAAHFSLYGVLANQVEPKFGYSFYSLACSVVPRIFWAGRPADIYNYYADSVGSIQGQGYSLHHATGWYLNFGYPGIALGGIVLGLAWAYCLRARRRIRPTSGLTFRLFAITAPWLFVAGIAPLVRAGPEAYKGLLIEGVLIPVGTLLFACRATGPSPRLQLRLDSRLALNARFWGAFS